MSDIATIALLAGAAGGAVWAAITLGFQAWRGRRSRQGGVTQSQIDALRAAILGDRA